MADTLRLEIATTAARIWWSLEDLEHPNNTLAEGVECKRFPQLEMTGSGHYHIVFREIITNAMFGKCDTHSGVPFGSWHGMTWASGDRHFCSPSVLPFIRGFLSLPSHSSPPPRRDLHPRGLASPFPYPSPPSSLSSCSPPSLLLSGMADRFISTKTDDFGVLNGLASCEHLPGGVAVIVLLCWFAVNDWPRQLALWFVSERSTPKHKPSLSLSI